MRRLLVAVLLALAAWGCRPAGPVPGPTPDGRPGAARLTVAPSARVVRFTAETPSMLDLTAPTVASDSIEVAASWVLPVQADAGTYGGIDTVRVDILGGFPSVSLTLWLPGNATSVTRNVPLNLSSGGSAGTIDARVCVQARRRGVDGPQTCRDTNPVPVVFPAPGAITGLTATATRRAFP